MNKLIGQLLQGLAVPVRIAEGGVLYAPLILDLADVHSPSIGSARAAAMSETTKCRA